MNQEALYTWIFEGLKMGFGSTILVTLILYLFSAWYYMKIVDLNNMFYALLFAAIPFLAGGVVGILTLSWGMGVAILLIGTIFTAAVAEMFKAN